MDGERRHVVVAGAGFAGLRTAMELADEPVEVTIVDRNNFHAFWPLLYQVGAAQIEASEMAHPVRTIVRGASNVRFRMAEVRGLDAERRVLRLADGELAYDRLVLALGSTPHFLGIEGAERHTLPLKTLDDGLEVRNRVLSRFERAASEPDSAVRRRLLRFVIVGGGPTGVEFAGALAELIRRPLRRDYPDLDMADVSVILLEAMDELLPGFDEKLWRYAKSRLEKLGVEVRLGAAVEAVTPTCVRLADGTELRTETVIWSAGVRGHPLAERLGLPVTKKGTVRVDACLRVEDQPGIYVAGDLAHFEHEGSPLPMTAPVATQQAERVAANILAELDGGEPAAFEYDDPGVTAVIGRNRAVARVGKRLLTGFPAWVVWAGVHIANLVGFRNRLVVMINWAADYLFYERAVRMILPVEGTDDPEAGTGEPGDPEDDSRAA